MLIAGPVLGMDPNAAEMQVQMQSMSASADMVGEERSQEHPGRHRSPSLLLTARWQMLLAASLDCSRRQPPPADADMHLAVKDRLANLTKG